MACLKCTSERGACGGLGGGGERGVLKLQLLYTRGDVIAEHMVEGQVGALEADPALFRISLFVNSVIHSGRGVTYGASLCRSSAYRL